MNGPPQPKEPPTGELIDGAWYEFIKPPPLPADLACPNLAPPPAYSEDKLKPEPCPKPPLKDAPQVQVPDVPVLTTKLKLGPNGIPLPPKSCILPPLPSYEFLEGKRKEEAERIKKLNEESKEADD